MFIRLIPLRFIGSSSSIIILISYGGYITSSSNINLSLCIIDMLGPSRFSKSYGVLSDNEMFGII